MNRLIGAILISDQKPKSICFFLVAVTLGFSCMIYEFALAQALSLLLGQTTLRYPITIGLYTAALGFGALGFNHVFKGTHTFAMKLIKLEVSIAIVSCLAFVLLFLCDFIFKLEWFQNYLPVEKIVMPILTHFLVLIIGIMAGAELPLLMAICEEKKILTSIRILAGDYFGTLLAAILFPLVFLPNLHLFSIIVFATLLNIMSGVYLYFSSIEHGQNIKAFWLFLLPTLSMLVLICLEKLF